MGRRRRERREGEVQGMHKKRKTKTNYGVWVHAGPLSILKTYVSPPPGAYKTGQRLHGHLEARAPFHTTRVPSAIQGLGSRPRSIF